MIPKVIHYCWFGRNPLPALALKCIESWKRYLPDYEIKEWNEDNFDINIIPYTQEAYRVRKYAFVSDYARFWILYNYGGLYFDTDVEIIKSMDDILSEGSFMGRESMILPLPKGQFTTDKCVPVNPGLGTNGKLNTKTVVQYTTEILLQYGLKSEDIKQKCMEVTIYPKDFFCPKSYENGKIYLTDNTHAIHHFAASWLSPKQRFIQLVKSLLGAKLSRYLSLFHKRISKNNCINGR